LAQALDVEEQLKYVPTSDTPHFIGCFAGIFKDGYSVFTPKKG